MLTLIMFIIGYLFFLVGIILIPAWNALYGVSIATVGAGLLYIVSRMCGKNMDDLEKRKKKP